MCNVGRKRCRWGHAQTIMCRKRNNIALGWDVDRDEKSHISLLFTQLPGQEKKLFSEREREVFPTSVGSTFYCMSYADSRMPGSPEIKPAFVPEIRHS